jgi:hypothetical protein
MLGVLSVSIAEGTGRSTLRWPSTDYHEPGELRDD